MRADLIKTWDLFLVLRKEVAVALKYALNLGFQIHPAALQVLEELETGDLNTVIKYIVKKKTREGTRLISREDVESFLGIGQDVSLEANLVVLFDPTDKVTTAEGLSGYDALFASRFAKMKQIISARPEAKKLRTIGNVAKMSGSDNDVFVCGLVAKKSTGPDSVKIVLEDTTGSLEAWVFEEGIRTEAEMLLLDQFVMIRIGRAKNNRFVVKELVLPGIPGHTINHSETESFAVFISDLHVGSDFFMEEAFLEFVSWLSSTDQVAKRVRFVVIGGDLVDGVGIYPNQDRGLVYQTVEEQLRRAEALLSQIPQKHQGCHIPGKPRPGKARSAATGHSKKVRRWALGTREFFHGWKPLCRVPERCQGAGVSWPKHRRHCKDHPGPELRQAGRCHEAPASGRDTSVLFTAA